MALRLESRRRENFENLENMSSRIEGMQLQVHILHQNICYYA